MNNIQNNKILIVFVLSISIIITIISIITANTNVNKNDKNSNNTNDNMVFTEKEQEVIDLIYNKLYIMSYFNNENLDYFNIVKITNVGYFESRSNIRYLEIKYEFACKDQTNKCNNLLDNKNDDHTTFAFFIKLDSTNKNYIEFRTQNSEDTVYFNSDWIQNHSSINDFPIYDN